MKLKYYFGRGYKTFDLVNEISRRIYVKISKRIRFGTDKPNTY